MGLQILVKFRHGGSFPMGWVEEYVGGKFDVRFIDKEDLNIERLMDEIIAIGYNNVIGLFYCVPGAGVANGGLRSLSDEGSLKEMLEHAERVKAIEIYVEHGIDEPAEFIMEDCDVLLLEGVSQPISESQTQPVEAQEDMQMPEATTPKKKGKVAGPRRSTPRRSTPRKATASANEKRTPKKATPKRKVTYPSTSRKKLTPRRATKLSTSSETLPQQEALISASLDDPCSAQRQSSTSSDSDDSVEDENYRMDPREAFVDDDFDEDELFDEFSNNGKGKKRRMCKRKRMKLPTVNVEGNESVPEPNFGPREAVNVEGNESVLEPNNEPREAVNVEGNESVPEPNFGPREAVNVEGNDSVTEPNNEPSEAVNVEGNESVPEPNNEPREAVNVEGNEGVPEPGQEDREAVNEVHSAHSDDSFQAAICSEDEELNEIRQCNKEILSQEMGNIALNSGAVLGDGLDAGNSIQFNTVRPPRVVNANVPTSPHEGVHSRARSQQQSWPDFFTNYDGGYESDPRSSGDEGPIMASDEDETLVQSLQKKAAKVKYPFFNEEVDMKNVKLSVGLKFTSREILKEAILNYSIQEHYDIVYEKNDKRQLNVNCALCHWQLNATPCRDDASAWKINSMHPFHTCSRTFKNRLITEAWLAGKFIDNFLRDPKFKPKDMKAEMQKQYEIIVDLRKCRRAKSRALNAVNGLFKKQYGLLKPYMRELLRSNVGSTCILKVTDQSDSSESGVFQRFYVCFAAMKRGFANNCRPIFGLDGCFLKHACGGQLLSAVGRDGNNQMWPIAWAVVEGETRSSWEWFMRILSNDLNMGEGEGWTVISDQQKGLVPAIHEVWPQVEHRQCARHIYSNWRKAHTGRTLQKSMGDFAREAGKLKDYSQRAYDDFMARDPHTFCKSHFKCHSQCDSVDNNMSETFNSFILLARYKPIISMLEDIRLAIMDRMQIKRKLITQFVGGIAPRISKKIKEGYQEQLHCQTRWSGTNDYSGFEIHHRGIGHEVNLGENTCSCRVWDLTGIPCPHAISAILFMRKNPEDFVAHWYKSEAYINAYESLLNPVQGTKFWDLQHEGSVLPPHSIRKPMGRPKHARRRDPTEGPRNQFKASRRGVQGRCTHCESSEHTRRKCPTAPPRQQATQESQGTRVDEGPSQVRKKGRPKGSLNKIRCGDMPPSNAPTPASIILGRRSKAPTTSAESGRGRGGGGRGRERGRGPSQLRMPEGFGLWQGPQGEMAFRAPGDSHVNVIHLTPNAPSSQSAPSQE